MKIIITRLFVFTVTALLFLASVTTASACLFTAYQTEVPETLRK